MATGRLNLRQSSSVNSGGTARQSPTGGGWLIGTYHGVSKAQLQVYLDEFVFRHNRRRQPMAAFQTVLGLGTGRAPTSYRRIRGAQDVRAAG